MYMIACLIPLRRMARALLAPRQQSCRLESILPDAPSTSLFFSKSHRPTWQRQNIACRRPNLGPCRNEQRWQESPRVCSRGIAKPCIAVLCHFRQRMCFNGKLRDECLNGEIFYSLKVRSRPAPPDGSTCADDWSRHTARDKVDRWRTGKLASHSLIFGHPLLTCYPHTKAGVCRRATTARGPFATSSATRRHGRDRAIAEPVFPLFIRLEVHIDTVEVCGSSPHGPTIFSASSDTLSIKNSLQRAKVPQFSLVVNEWLLLF
jgi:hypothetical protein